MRLQKSCDIKFPIKILARLSILSNHVSVYSKLDKQLDKLIGKIPQKFTTLRINLHYPFYTKNPMIPYGFDD